MRLWDDSDCLVDAFDGGGHDCRIGGEDDGGAEEEGDGNGKGGNLHVRPCPCKGITGVKGIKNEFVHNVYKAASDFILEEPHLHLRKHHILHVELPGLAYKYVLVTGWLAGWDVTEPIGIVAFKDWESVKWMLEDGERVDEVGSSESSVKAKAHGTIERIAVAFIEAQKAGVWTPWDDIEFIEREFKSGEPVKVVDAELEKVILKGKEGHLVVKPHHVIPVFRRVVTNMGKDEDGNIGKMDLDGNVVPPFTGLNLDELAYLRIAL
ncbi:hypothetical protein HDU76_013621 [Blyttiomyces sp. JEL0837]|nr:hypothetical protein HDU76_013621 [Blyttiomyces sp. JEL0837]